MLNDEAQSAQLAAVLVKGEEDLDALSPVEYRQFQSHVYASINAIKAAHGFFMEGILDEEEAPRVEGVCLPLPGRFIRQYDMGVFQAHMGD